MTLFKAHIFGRARRGDREEVNIKLFNPDGSVFTGGSGPDLAPTDPEVVPLRFQPADGATANATKQITINDDTGEEIGYWDAAGKFFVAISEEVMDSSHTPHMRMDPDGIQLLWSNGSKNAEIDLGESGFLLNVDESGVGVFDISVSATDLTVIVGGNPVFQIDSTGQVHLKAGKPIINDL